MKYNYHNKKIEFDKIYPILYITFEHDIKTISWAINEEVKNTSNMSIKGNTVSFENIHIRYLYLDSPNRIKHLELDNHFIITEELPINNIFRRNEGWAGADGIFSHVYKNTVHWYFSDTLVGKVNKDTRIREDMVMVNNSVGVSSINSPFDIKFLVNQDEEKKYISFYEPIKEGYYWLQDGVMKDNHLYISVIRVRNDKEHWFKVLGSEMIKVPLLDDESLDYCNYQIFDTPTYFETKDETYTFGAAMLDDTSRTGYYYMFGYDNSIDKNLYMLRLTDFENSSSYEFYTSNGWTKEPNSLKVIGTNIANEMRVIYDKEYIISYTKKCASETIELATTKDLEKGFTNIRIIYQCNESIIDNTLITYNAKLHQFPQDDDYYVTYNVNTTVVEDLIDADIYYPRWLKLTKESD